MNRPHRYQRRAAPPGWWLAKHARTLQEVAGPHRRRAQIKLEQIRERRRAS